MNNAARQPTAEEAGASGDPSTAPPAADTQSADAQSADAQVKQSADTRVKQVHGALVGRTGLRFARWWGTPGAVDAVVCLAYLSFAFWITAGLWPNPATRAIADNFADQALIEWFLAHGVLVWTGDFSFVTDRLNSPEGVNLMVNASHILHGVIMAPVTALFGAAVSFALLVAVNLAATASGWYLLLVHTVGLRRGAAVIGGAFAGFAPGMISQSNSHLHMTAQWLVPPIVWCVIRLTRTTTLRGTVATALGLAGLIAAQVLLGEEVLFLTTLVVLIFSITYAVCQPEWTRRVATRFLGGLLMAAGAAAILLAYPLWVQFWGAQHTPNAPFAPQFFYADLASFALFSPLSIAGTPAAGMLATSSAEYNTYLGLPLILVVLGCAVWRWHSPVIKAATVTAVIMAYLSLGPFVTYHGVRTGWPSIYSRIADIPVISGALPTRYALALIPLIGLILACAVDAAFRIGGLSCVTVPVLVVAALLPAMPAPLATTNRAPVPKFISSGAWRQCAPDGGVIVPVPLPTPHNPDLMRWPAAANAAFAIPEGFFIAPYGPGGRSSIGIYPRPTSQFLAQVAATGIIPPINDSTRAQARDDLAYWKANCVALAKVPNEGQLHRTLEELLGPGATIADTWTWKV